MSAQRTDGKPCSMCSVFTLWADLRDITSCGDWHTVCPKCVQFDDAEMRKKAEPKKIARHRRAGIKLGA